MMHIMISDHDYEIYKTVKDVLQSYYEISQLSKDKAIEESLQQEQVDLVLLTISTENTNPFSTYDKIMQIPELIQKPVIFLAKEGSAELEQRVLKLRAFDYIAWPVSSELLLHRIGTCLELIALRKERPYVEKYQDAISFSFAELVEFRDETTGGHLKNTQIYFQILLEAALADDTYSKIIPPEDTRDLLRSVMLHDIGKIGINDEILRKASNLNYDEYEYMKTHTTLGKQAFEKIIKETGGTGWLYLARDMAYSHHERWDGKGYPNGLKGEEIPLYARMLAIVDVYDALTSNRAYKEAFSHQKAMEIIVDGKGTCFDPKLVELFVKVSKQFEEALNMKNERE